MSTTTARPDIRSDPSLTRLHLLRAGYLLIGVARALVKWPLLPASPTPTDRYDAHLHTQDASRALLAALLCPGGIYNVCDDSDPVSHDRFTK